MAPDPRLTLAIPPSLRRVRLAVRQQRRPDGVADEGDEGELDASEVLVLVDNVMKETLHREASTASDKCGSVVMEKLLRLCARPSCGALRSRAPLPLVSGHQPLTLLTLCGRGRGCLDHWVALPSSRRTDE